jgi:hypothetical protein
MKTMTMTESIEQTIELLRESAQRTGSHLVAVIGTSDAEEMAKRLQVAAVSMRGLYAFEGEAIDQVNELLATIAARAVLAGEPASHQRLQMEICAELLSTVIRCRRSAGLFDRMDERSLDELRAALQVWQDDDDPETPQGRLVQ